MRQFECVCAAVDWRDHPHFFGMKALQGCGAIHRKRILALDDCVVAILGSPITRLNRIVALSEVHGCNAALVELSGEIGSAESLSGLSTVAAVRKLPVKNRNGNQLAVYEFQDGAF